VTEIFQRLRTCFSRKREDRKNSAAALPLSPFLIRFGNRCHPSISPLVYSADLLSFVLRSLASVSRYNFVALYHICKHHDGMALQDGKADMPIPFFVFV
jgi:hypothetical protein